MDFSYHKLKSIILKAVTCLYNPMIVLKRSHAMFLSTLLRRLIFDLKWRFESESRLFVRYVLANYGSDTPSVCLNIICVGILQAYK